jgi:DinB superfamily
MSETPQQYTARILDYVDGQEPLEVQAASAGRIASLIDGVSAAVLRARPGPDKWSVSEILAHFADGEIVGAFRIRSILAAPGSPLAAYDQDRWVESGHYDQRDPRQSLDLFRVVRQANLALLESLEPAQWQHSGIHSERGPESIERIVRMFAGHDLNHIRQIERILERG